ncbi:MAG TPA: hypothetical protein VHK01_21695 [Lacipirellulaceae bacterium]|jgi:ribosomal protein L37E|nr:hypothetical protein [Lacipirellulaceae bacterium]
MPSDEPEDDDDWYDDDDELDDEEAARCPECGEPIHIITDKCSTCGYWLSDADRRAMWSGMSKPRWLKVTAVIVLIAFLLSILGTAVAILK